MYMNQMSAILVEIPLDELPKSTVETLKSEAIRCGEPLDKLIARGAVRLAEEITAAKRRPKVNRPHRQC